MIHAFIYSVVGLLLLTYVGNVICRGIFKITGLAAATAHVPAPDYRAGRVIGILERLILVAGIMLQSWEILVAVIALKTVARFQKMDQREFAEYFLVGSLFSILWALVVTGAWSAYDQHIGINLRQTVRELLSTEQPLAQGTNPPDLPANANANQ